MKKTILSILACILFAGAAIARQDIGLEATLERNRVSTGNPVYLNVTFYGDNNVKISQMPNIDGLRINYVGPASRTSIINGEVTKSVSHAYLVFPLKPGDFSIGPFYADYRGRTYEAPAVHLRVDGTPTTVGSTSARGSVTVPIPPSSSRTSSGSSGVRNPEIESRVALKIELPKTKVYINESIPITIKLYVNNLALKDIEYPSFPHEGFSVGELAEPEKKQEVVRGSRYNVLVFKQDMFGIKEGSYIIGPATLSCKALMPRQTSRRSSLFGRSVFNDDFFDNIFSRSDIYPMDVESNSIPVTVLPFPKKDRPSYFEGAVGKFSMEVHTDKKEVKVGDPVVVRMIISGYGNLDTVSAPKVEPSESFKTYEPQVSKKGSTKIYEQVFIPKTKGDLTLPVISFSYFDPASEKYETITAGGEAVRAIEREESEKGVMVVSMPGVQNVIYPEEKLGTDIIHIKQDIGTVYPSDYFLYKSGLFWAGQSVTTIIFILLFVSHRKKERIRTDRKYARVLRAPKAARSGLKRATSMISKGKIVEFYDEIFKTLQNYLGNRLDLARASITYEVVGERLSHTECEEEIKEALKEVFSTCDSIRYASIVPSREEAERELDNVKRIINYLERAKL